MKGNSILEGKEGPKLKSSEYVGLSKICYRVLEKEDRNSFGDFQ
jgi:hypothetical protein